MNKFNKKAVIALFVLIFIITCLSLLKVNFEKNVREVIYMEREIASQYLLDGQEFTNMWRNFRKHNKIKIENEEIIRQDYFDFIKGNISLKDFLYNFNIVEDEINNTTEVQIQLNKDRGTWVLRKRNIEELISEYNLYIDKHFSIRYTIEPIKDLGSFVEDFLSKNPDIDLEFFEEGK